MHTVERLEPLHCLGESHCLRFRDRLHRAQSPSRLLHARAHFQMHIEASNFTDKGGLHPDLAAAMVAAGICTERRSEDGSVSLEATHRATTFADRVLAARHAALADEPLVAPALLLFAGDKELHSLAMKFGPRTDFELPQDPGYPWIADAVRVPYDTVEAALAERLGPFLAGLEMLREAGFTRTLVHGLQPRCRDDARTARWCQGVRIPASLRSKLAVVANRLLTANCRRIGVGFVDVWNALASDGYLDPRFDLDGVHANHAATSATFATVAARLADLDDGRENHAQYELLTELAVARCRPWTAADAEFEQCGLALWAAEQVPGFCEAAVTAAHDLAGLHAALRAPTLRTALETGWQHEVGVCCVATTWSETSPAASPVGVRAAWWSRRDSGNLACTVSRGDGTSAELTLRPGSLLVFDPTRVGVRCAQVEVGKEPLCLRLLPRLPEELVRVLSTLSGGWPADPFWIPVVDAAAWPPVGSTVLRRWCEVEGRTVQIAAVPASDAEPAALVGVR